MFNLAKISQVKNTEKQLRDSSEVKDSVSVTTEKQMDKKKKPLNTITEKQMDRPEKDFHRVIEKVLNDNKGLFQSLRDDTFDLDSPPISVLVEKIRIERNSEHFKKEDFDDWTINDGSKEQNGELPDWPRVKKQHDKIVLNNDPRRFTEIKIDNTITGGEMKPLTGEINQKTASKIASKIKNGISIDFDTAIVAILKQADSENRELNDIEKNEINELKKQRTSFLLKND